MVQVRFHDLVFDAEFLAARRDDGVEVRFTRRERVLLQVLARRPRRLFSRAELMDALESDGSDRVVDFVVNRLRAKLGDTARQPRFVGAQYGEGYVWIAPALPPVASEAFLVVGPVIGGGEGAASGLAAVLQDRAPPGRGVLLAPAWRRGGDGMAAPRFSLEVRFRAAEAALFVRDEPTGRVVRSIRRPAGEIADGHLATEVMDAIWEALALGAPGALAPEDLPIHLRMQRAAVALDAGQGPWAANLAPIRRGRRRDPGDARFAVMAALQAAAGPILATNIEPLSWASLRPVEDEVERLIMGCLEDVQTDPMLAIGAAKALHIVQRRLELVEPLTRGALESSAAFAAALPMLGQIHAARGELARAIELYDEARGMTDPGSDADLYILNIKAAALLAADDRPGVARLFDELMAYRPGARAGEGRLFAAPRRWSGGPHLDDAYAALDRAGAIRTANYQYFVVARYFEDRQHQANVMEGVLDHLVARFGPDVVPDEIWSALEGDLNRLRAPALA